MAFKEKSLPSGKQTAVSQASSGTAPVPECSRKLLVERVGHGVQEIVEATPEECAALSRRFGFVALKTLYCSFSLRSAQQGVFLAKGRIRARVVQSCAITGEPVQEVIDEWFSLRFVPQDGTPDNSALDWENLLDDDADEVAYDGRIIDLGEAAAEQLALCADPYPRREGSGLEQFVDVTPEGDGGTADSDDKPHPFAGLGQIKDRKGMA